MRVRNAGTAERRSFMSTFAKFLSIRTPTNISAGAVAQEGTTPARGVRNRQKKKQIAVIRLAKPVLAPAATPAADSTKVVQVEVPMAAPAAVAMESQFIALFMSMGSPFSSSIFASVAAPYRVPTVSNISTIQKEMIRTMAEKIPPMCSPVNASFQDSASNRPEIPIFPKSEKDFPMEEKSKLGACQVTT